VQKAALELDVAPDEFRRRAAPAAGAADAAIADTLINGSDFAVGFASSVPTAS
jgi:hypothetical protein